MTSHLDRLATLHAVAIATAGPDFMWDSVNAPKTLNSAHRRGLTLLLLEAQGGLCAACGDAVGSERYDLCHIVASRRSERGVMAGNAYVGHTGCNSDDDKVFSTNGGILPLSSLVRSDLVQVEFPSRAKCLARDAHVTDMRAERRARRAAHLAGE